MTSVYPKQPDQWPSPIFWAFTSKEPFFLVHFACMSLFATSCERSEICLHWDSAFCFLIEIGDIGTFVKKEVLDKINIIYPCCNYCDQSAGRTQHVAKSISRMLHSPVGQPKIEASCYIDLSEFHSFVLKYGQISKYSSLWNWLNDNKTKDFRNIECDGQY